METMREVPKKFWKASHSLHKPACPKYDIVVHFFDQQKKEMESEIYQTRIQMNEKDSQVRKKSQEVAQYLSKYDKEREKNHALTENIEMLSKVCRKKKKL